MKQSPELSFDDDFDGEGRPVLITRAAPAYEEQHRQRVRKYLTLMSFRIPALLLAAVAYNVWHNGLISLAIILVSLPLPWMAVLIANDRPPRRRDEPRRYAAGGASQPVVSAAEWTAMTSPQQPGPHAVRVEAPQSDATPADGDAPT